MEQDNDNTKRRHWKQLSENSRYKIEAWCQEGASAGRIAELLGYSKRTIEREIKRGMVLQRRQNANFKKYEPEYTEKYEYKADYAQKIHNERSEMKGRGLKIGHDLSLASYIEGKILNDKWSPDAVIGRILEENIPFDTSICTKTVYNYIDRGIFTNLTNKDLPIKKDGRKQRHHKVRSVALNNRNGKSIDERPAEASNREEPGHWEIDLVIGRKGTQSVIMTLVERKSRMSAYALAQDKSQESVTAALRKTAKRIRADFGGIIRTITADNGSEFLDGDGIRKASGCDGIYYCHPYSSWEKGSNENGNRILRRFVPKGTDIGLLTEEELRRIEDWVNSYPRRILGYRTAAEAMKEEAGKQAA